MYEVQFSAHDFRYYRHFGDFRNIPEMLRGIGIASDMWSDSDCNEFADENWWFCGDEENPYNREYINETLEGFGAFCESAFRSGELHVYFDETESSASRHPILIN